MYVANILRFGENILVSISPGKLQLSRSDVSDTTYRIAREAIHQTQTNPSYDKQSFSSSWYMLSSSAVLYTSSSMVQGSYRSCPTVYLFLQSTFPSLDLAQE